jgi:hypothetical protein
LKIIENNSTSKKRIEIDKTIKGLSLFIELENTSNGSLIKNKYYYRLLSEHRTPLAHYVANKLPNTNSLDSLYGQSSYSESLNLFSMLDQILTIIDSNVRKSSIQTYIPDQMVMKDFYGEPIDKKTSRLFRKNILSNPGAEARIEHMSAN